MTLRPLSLNDHALTLAWRNRETVRHGMFNTDIIPPENHRKWISGVIENAAKAYFVYEEDHAPLGVVGLIFRNPETGEAEWSFHIGAEGAPKGAGTRMLAEAIERFFTVLDGQVLYGEVLEDNTPSRRVHEKLGFKNTGTLPETVTHDAKEKSVFSYELTRDAWHGFSQPTNSRDSK